MQGLEKLKERGAREEKLKLREVVQDSKMLKYLDRFWQYVTPIEGVRGNSQHFKCNLCNKAIRGTITRFKGHLFGRPRSDVESFPKATPDLALDAITALDSIVDKKERK